MSASRDKQRRQAERQSPDYKPPKQKKGMPGFAKVTIKIAVVLVVLLAVCWGVLTSGILFPYITALTVEGENISIAEYNFYLNSTASNYILTMQQRFGTADISSLVPTMSKDLKSQKYSDEQTWAQFFEEQVSDGIRNIVARNKKAEAAGITLDDTDKQLLEDQLKTVRDQASQTGTGTASLLSSNYGKGVNIAVFRKVLNRDYLVSKFNTDFSEKVDLSTEAMEEYYPAHKDDIDEVSFRMFTFNVSSEHSSEDEHEHSEEELAAAKTEAVESAQKKSKELASKITSPDNFNTYAKEYAAAEGDDSDYDDPSTAYRRGMLKSDITSNFDETFSDWMFDPARKDNEVGVIEIVDAEDNITNIIVAMRLSRNRGDYKMVNVRHILVAPETDEETGKATDSQWTDALTKAQGYYDEYLAGNKSEESFAALAAEYTGDNGSIETGGLYTDVTQGAMVAQFDEWIFDPARKVGDTDIVRTRFGYHIMYFSGWGDVRWEPMAKEGLTTQAEEDLQAEIDEAYSYTGNPFWMYFAGTK